MSKTKLKIGLLGADGRMGQAVEAVAGDAHEIAARVSAASPDPAGLGGCDVVIDFSTPDALLPALAHVKDGAALVSGTTGLDADQERAVQDAASRLAVLRSGNFSLGVAVLTDLARQAANRLGPQDWDIEVLEMHHRHKADAPSGTALMLGEAVAQGRGVALDDTAAHNRNGVRREGDIGFAVLRGGGVYGMHEVRLVSGSEMITLGHQAIDRNVFARGAVSAAQWLAGREPGLYGMGDLVG
jgi:4-hydroxy-tetrahydrodipicolinate reductase